MAKGKHSAALFEVITRSKPLSRQARPGFFQRISRWLKPAPFPDSPTPTCRSSGGDQAGSPPSPPDPTLAPSSGRSDAPSALSPIYPGGLPSRTGIAVDPVRHELALRISYFSASIVGIAILTALAAAFVIGHKAGKQSAVAQTDDEISGEPANGAMFDLSGQRRDSTDSGARQSAAAGRSSQAPATEQAHGRERVVGRNYLILQSYPDQKTAADMAKLIAQNGVECTVEKVPKWTSPTWWCVVGVDGYTRVTGNAELEAQKKKIADISAKLGKRGPLALTASPFRWEAADTAASAR